MAAIVSSPTVLGRISPFIDLAAIMLTVNANGATYATATGGLPFDIAALLSAGLVNDLPYINPGDVISIPIPSTSTTGKYLTSILALGTPTYTAVSGSGYGSASGLPAPMSVQPDNTLTTFPCTIRLFNGTTEFSDGACSEVFSILLIISRNGVNA